MIGMGVWSRSGLLGDGLCHCAEDSGSALPAAGVH